MATSRKRVVSESAKYDCNVVSLSLGDDFTCNRIRGEGHHSCGNEEFHIQNDFLNIRDTCMLSQAILEEALELTLPCLSDNPSLPDSNGETIHQVKSLQWKSHEVERICNNNLINDLLEPISVNNGILVLLSRLNRHAKAKLNNPSSILNSVKMIRAAYFTKIVSLNTLIPSGFWDTNICFDP